VVCPVDDGYFTVLSLFSASGERLGYMVSLDAIAVRQN
jgi:hypothetical protein